MDNKSDITVEMRQISFPIDSKILANTPDLGILKILNHRLSVIFASTTENTVIESSSWDTSSTQQLKSF